MPEEVTYTVPNIAPEPKKTQKKSRLLFVVGFLLLLTIPLIVYYITQRDKNIAEVRTRANPYNFGGCDVCTETAAKCTNPPPTGLGGTISTNFSCLNIGYCCSIPLAPSPTGVRPTPTPMGQCIGVHDCRTVTLERCDSSCPQGPTYTRAYQLCVDSQGRQVACFDYCHFDTYCVNPTPTILPTPGIIMSCYDVPANQCGGPGCNCNQLNVSNRYCDNGSGPKYISSLCDTGQGGCVCNGNPTPTHGGGSNPTNTPIRTPTQTPTPTITPGGPSLTPTPTNTPGPSPTPTPSDTPTQTLTPSITPTPPAIGMCLNIKIFKDGVQLTPPFVLMPGDQVQFTVLGSNNPTMAHFRVNGGTWMETTTLNGFGEFVLDYTIPDGLPSISVDAEVFVDGAWK